MSTILYTSLAEIRSFNPCARGWKDILSAHPHKTEEDMNQQFPLVDCLRSNSISDVCWLIGRRQKEIQICVKFARMCADSVKHLDNINSAATTAAAYADAADAADAAAADAYAAAYAAYADAAYAAAAAADAYEAYEAHHKQKELNKSFLIQCINEFEQGELK